MRYAKLMAVACSFMIMMLCLTGCAELSSMYEGATGGDISAVESVTFYKIGEALMPFLSQLFSILRVALGL